MSPLDAQLGMLAYSTGGRGSGGRARSRAEDFVVAEVLAAPPKGGDLAAFSVTKVMRNTAEVAEELGRRAGCRLRYWGLKDRRAVTTQIMQCAGRAKRPPPRIAKGQGWRAILIGFVEEMTPSQFAGNAFRIRLEGVEHAGAFDEVARALVDGEVANFFGYQRFGYRDQNHLLGRCIVRPSEGCPPREELRVLDPKVKRLAVEAYQSYLFNLALSRVLLEEGGLPRSSVSYRRSDKPCPRAVGEPRAGSEGIPAAPLPGYAYRGRGDPYSRALDEVMREEGVAARDFYLDWMPGASEEGGWRPAALLGNMRYSAEGGYATVIACLQRGSYATVLLREAIKPADPAAAGLAYRGPGGGSVLLTAVDSRMWP